MTVAQVSDLDGLGMRSGADWSTRDRWTAHVGYVRYSTGCDKAHCHYRARAAVTLASGEQTCLCPPCMGWMLEALDWCGFTITLCGVPASVPAVLGWLSR